MKLGRSGTVTLHCQLQCEEMALLLSLTLRAKWYRHCHLQRLGMVLLFTLRGNDIVTHTSTEKQVVLSKNAKRRWHCHCHLH